MRRNDGARTFVELERVLLVAIGLCCVDRNRSNALIFIIQDQRLILAILLLDFPRLFTCFSSLTLIGLPSGPLARTTLIGLPSGSNIQPTDPSPWLMRYPITITANTISGIDLNNIDCDIYPRRADHSSIGDK